MIDRQPLTEQRASRAPLWSRPSRAALFTAESKSGRSRRPTDVAVLALCILGLFAVVKTSTPPAEFWQRLSSLATSVPGFFNILWRAALWLMTGWAVFLVVAPVARGRLDILRDQVLALVGSTVAVVVVEAVIGGKDRSLWDALVAGGPPPDTVSVRLGLAVAAIGTISPYITRPFRALGWWLIGFGAFSVGVLAVSAAGGAVLGLLCGFSAAATVHIVFGSSGGRPSLAEVRKGLADLGVQVSSLSAAPAQETGAFLLDAIDSDGTVLRVKAYGRDAWDAQLIAKAWRALWFRGSETLSLSRLQQVVHEGFVTLLAARNGVATQDLVRAGQTADRDALIVMRVRGEPLADDDCAAAEPEVNAMWDTVLALGSVGLAHGDLHPDAFHFDRGQAVIDSMARASVATDQDERWADVAQLLAVSAVLLGSEDALALAVRRLGPADMASIVPYIQKAALGPRMREATGRGHIDIDDLRSRAAAVAGVDAPRIAKLRRVSTRALVQTALLVLAAYFIITTLAGVDINEVFDALRAASLPLLLLALVVGQLPRFAYAESTRAACPRPIAYGPTVLLQFTVTFINLVLPSTVARMALNVRFFQQQGIPPASAVSIGLIDNLGTYTVQIFVILCALLFGFGELNLDFDLSAHKDNGLVVLLVALIAGAILVVVVAAAVPRLRRLVFERIRPHMADVRDTLAPLRSPSKVARLLLANLAAEILFACTLGVVLVSLGSPLPLATLLVINVGVSFFAGMIPVPGGIGVSEGALVVGLTAGGIDQSTAFAAAICYRLCTFYLPPIWGWFAMRRLEKSGLL
jgi:glycosyltransferase 2 family protein